MKTERREEKGLFNHVLGSFQLQVIEATGVAAGNAQQMLLFWKEQFLWTWEGAPVASCSSPKPAGHGEPGLAPGPDALCPATPSEDGQGRG